ncbi:putative 3-methyladenine DNA glycosylase [Paraburkholderia piptadeniae]|uniref:Putative 3-methyladenine DNA glycosylase n=1 Tax=Paraburkholderia piptadeniae TaxID=1701573 RepID=A0A1N7SL12_9BURK|nr:DNA-3-methyladenine glycosylase [Paraburkholderia piptadeniae]SIT48070.1 putative 3-methyladenine DNA glycosylase [Paraburkholderia piptadeniae]
MVTTTLPIVPLRRNDLPVDTVDLARFMLGKYLVHDLREGRVAGRIVETEAYPVGDSTNHAWPGRRAYNGSMFLARGHAYVRLTYGIYNVINVVSEREGTGAAVLIRALEPVEGIEWMQARRPDTKPRDLARGPGRLALALGIDLGFDGADLCTGRGLWLGAVGRKPAPFAVTTRIGIARETHRLLRFYEPGSPFVSGPRKLLSAG